MNLRVLLVASSVAVLCSCGGSNSRDRDDDRDRSERSERDSVRDRDDDRADRARDDRIAGRDSRDRIPSGGMAGGTPTVGAPAAASTPAPATGAVTAQWVNGMWGPNCPASMNGAIGFMSNGTMMNTRGQTVGRWYLGGNVMQTTIQGRVRRLIWNYVGPDTAKVSGQILGRCAG